MATVVLDVVVVTFLCAAAAFALVGMSFTLSNEVKRGDLDFVQGTVANVELTTGKTRRLELTLVRDASRYWIHFGLLNAGELQAVLRMKADETVVRLLVHKQDIEGPFHSSIPIYGIYAGEPVLTYEEFAARDAKGWWFMAFFAPLSAVFIVFGLVKKIRLWRQGKTSELDWRQ